MRTKSKVIACEHAKDKQGKDAYFNDMYAFKLTLETQNGQYVAVAWMKDVKAPLTPGTFVLWEPNTDKPVDGNTGLPRIKAFVDNPNKERSFKPAIDYKTKIVTGSYELARIYTRAVNPQFSVNEIKNNANIIYTQYLNSAVDESSFYKRFEAMKLACEVFNDERFSMSLPDRQNIQMLISVSSSILNLYSAYDQPAQTTNQQQV